MWIGKELSTIELWKPAQNLQKEPFVWKKRKKSIVQSKLKAGAYARRDFLSKKQLGCNLLRVLLLSISAL